MRRSLLVLTVAMISLVVLAGSGVSPVGALSCAPHPDGSPTAIASGTERLSTEDSFFDRYNFVVLGAVTEVNTVAVVGPDYGATTLNVDVIAVLGDELAPHTLKVSSPDPGWMAGYPYETGLDYFIPIQAQGPEGESNYSFLCDPITEVDAGIATELLQLASDAGIPFSTPDVAPTPEEEPDDSAAAVPVTESGMPASGNAIALAVMLAVIVAVLAVMLHRAGGRSVASLRSSAPSARLRRQGQAP